tara:strand:+ start:363 stop:1670 length:1308 start_codon:yes stop_codon:yes gene_type:complete
MKKKQDTIFALSTPMGRSAIAIIRVSGKGCYEIIKKISRSPPKKPNKATLNKIYSKKNGTIDQSITTYYKSPKSYTGEDMVEISVHGGSAVINEIISLIGKAKNTRQALPGEFTRRAFENNKLDLAQVEAVSDLVNAETEHQRKQAYNQLEGTQSYDLQKIHSKLIKVLANSEAIIDFADEDLPKNIMKDIKEQIKNIIKEIDVFIDKNNKTRKIHEGFVVGIIGKSNTGKSSFINNISNQEISIVTKNPGTTRDLIESYVDVEGLPIRFYDSAGIRKSRELVEKIGIKKSRELAKKSDINLIFIEKYNEIRKYKNLGRNIYVQSKFDIRKKPLKKENIINISSKTSYGLKKLINKIKNEISNLSFYEPRSISRERHINYLKNANKNLKNSIKNKNYDVFCEDIRLALNEISKIYGKTDIEDILGIIFSDFCIGK